jgi:hypothetical protein
MRIGDDGKARIAFSGTDGIRLGVINGTKLVSSTIPGTERGLFPSLVLAPGNVSYLVWIRTDPEGGCVSGELQPQDGTFFSTNASGKWVTTRLSKELVATSLAVDPTSGDVQVLLSDYSGLVLYQKPAAGQWTHHTLLKSDAWGAALRRDPTTGHELIAMVASAGESPAFVQVMTFR